MKYSYQYYKERGLCPQCGKPAENGKVHCAKCSEYRKKYVKQTRNFLREQGICPVCQKEKLYGDEKNCILCNAKKKKDIKRDRTEYFKKRKENGLCSCCSRKAKQGHTMCSMHLAKMREKARDKRGLERIYRVENGLCYFCGEPVMVDRHKTMKVCEKHYLICCKNAEKARLADGSVWKKGGL